MLPEIPEHLGIPNPVTEGYIEQYIPYLMTDEKEPDEDYTYGSRLWIQIPHFIDHLKKIPNTNQAILQVAQPEDRYLQDPPCLRHIDMKIKRISIPGTDNFRSALIFYPYFRSWDLWGGFPANLAVLAILQRYMADEIGIDPGPIVAYSKGLHIYGYVEELAKLRCYKS
jgi:thymidylate synthase